ncbi:hypothetical protein V6N11_019914 [Hibiscus sabdariffa]|uniref:Uncharacterized protein n=2 Tax=Hibiscus sabdariffa TaxID=183260 RepID=A0ABR2ATN3_9ROSI
MAGDKDDDFSELTRKAKEFERGNWLKKTAEAGVQNLKVGNSAGSSRTSSKRFHNSRDLGRNISAQSQRSTGSFAQRRQFPSSSMVSSGGSARTPTMLNMMPLWIVEGNVLDFVCGMVQSFW